MRCVCVSCSGDPARGLLSIVAYATHTASFVTPVLFLFVFFHYSCVKKKLLYVTSEEKKSVFAENVRTVLLYLIKRYSFLNVCVFRAFISE